MKMLYCVGCGPGDYELLTLKAARLIKECEIIFYPTSKKGRESIALSIIKPIIDARENKPELIELIFPMVKDKRVLEETWSKNAKIIAENCKDGKIAVYLCVGDPSLYSTFSHIYKRLKDYNLTIEIVPGIASMLSFAAEAKINLAEGDDILSIIPACYDLERAKSIAEASDTLIFLKDGRYFANVMKILRDSKFKNSKLAIAENISSENSVIKISSIKDFNDIPVAKYFSIMVVKNE